MNRVIKSAVLYISLFLVACGGSSNTEQQPTTNSPAAPVFPEITTPATSVVYQLTFTRSWQNSNFPTNFPNNSHFSPVVGLTHSQPNTLFELGALASQGVINMAETGSKTALKNEISTIQNEGGSNYLIDEGGISGNATSVTMTFEACQAFSLLTLVSMVAPSHDWFVAVNSLPLFNNNTWLQNQTIQLKVYDAGSDSGRHFSSANLATTPLEKITLLTSERADSDFDLGVHFTTNAHIGFIEITLLE